MAYFTTQSGVSIYYEEAGQPGNPPVIMVHGLASALGIWKPQIVEFQEHFHVFALDLPGHGNSGRQNSYTVHDLPQMLLDFMDFLNLENANFIGLSVGSTAIILFALAYPQRVSSLVIQGPAAGLSSFRTPAGWWSFIQLSLTIGGILTLWKLFGRRFSGKIINWFGKTYQYSTLLTGMEEKLDRSALIGYAYSNANAPYVNRLHEITAPVLILRGLDDQFPRQYSFYIKENVKGLCFWLEIPLTEHLASLEKPVEFNMAATAFLMGIQKADMLNVIKAADAWKDAQGVS